ncbi:MAG: aminoacyl-tRNA hydrolase [Clostridia bacterium]|nr:aminoacyl-tRNA hydrolase [Clostridia bacterium]
MTGIGDLLRRLFRREDRMEKETWIIFGLGNPGAKYAHTRHNVGFDTVDRLAAYYQVSLSKEKCEGKIAEINAGDRRLVLCEPLTLMNRSGDCVAPLIQWYKTNPDHTLVVCDDIDLPPGRLRLRSKGGPGTHNGLRSISRLIPDGSYDRLRVGIGNPPPEMDLVGWVLSRAEGMDPVLDRAAEAARDWFENGIDHAMSRFNGKGNA